MQAALLYEEQRAQAASRFSTAQALEALRFKLSHAFAGQTEIAGDFFERVLTFATNPEAHANHFFFGGRKRLESILRFVLQIAIDQLSHEGAGRAIFEQIAEH